ncbi:CRPV-180 [Crowpox virus]|nr:CRPV-180 [Crowpox virus]
MILYSLSGPIFKQFNRFNIFISIALCIVARK